MYLGRSPAIGTQKVLDSLESQFNGTLTTFDLRYNGTPTYPTISSSLIVSLGGVLQEPGEAYYVSSDQIVFATAPPTGSDCWILLYSEYGAAAGSGSSGGAVSVATGEPMGHEERTDSAISFDDSTRTFTIEPASGISEFVVWTKGVKRTYSTAQTVQIGTTTGLYYIYFDAFGVLQYRTTYFVWDEDTPTAYVYWNATTSTGVFVADERHGITLDWATHEYLHRTRGAVIASGFGISNYTTTGDGSADSHAQFDLANGTFFDEDLEVGITHSATPSAGTFTQVLQGNAELPVYYLSGSEGDWVRDTATEYACKQSATTLQYNSLSGSTWSTTAANDNRYVVSWIVATNELSAPVIAILGQEQYSSIGTAEEAVWGDLTLTNFPIFEFRPLWKIIFRTNSTFTNTPNAYIANVLDLREFSSTGIAGTIVNDHGLLSGLADDDHAQYLHASVDRTGVTANISTTGNITAANLIATGQLQGPANFVIDPATIGDNTGTVEIKGNLTVQGTQTTVNSTTVDLDHLSLGDNEIANFGNSNDLQIYHANPHTHIRETGSGALKIEGANINIDNADGSKRYIDCNDGGSVELYYDNVKKFETTSTGAKVSGTLHIFENQATLLTLERNGTANAGIRYENDTSQMFAGLSSNANFFGIGTSENIASSATQLVVMRTTGNVGIGTTSPLQKLDVLYSTVAGNRHFSTYNSNGVRLQRRGDVDGWAFEYGFLSNNGTDLGGFGGLGSSTGITNYYIGVDYQNQYLSVTSTGNVGIGISIPETILHIKSEYPKLRLESTNQLDLSAGAEEIGRIEWEAYKSTNYNVAASIRVRQDGTWSTITPWYSPTAIEFYTQDQSGVEVTSPRLTIKSDGNIGIGTTNPSIKLHVIAAAPEVIKVERNSANNAGIQYTNTLGSMYAGLGNNADVFGISTLSNIGQDAHFVVTRSTGNVGVGITNPSSKLEVKSVSGTNDIKLIAEAGYDNSITFEEAGSNYFRILHEGSAGLNPDNLFKIQTATTTSGINNTAITITQSGNVGIGTAAPSSKIDISASGDGTELLRFSTEREWVFRQKDSGTTTRLSLQSIVGNKYFNIDNVDGDTNIGFYAATSVSSSSIVVGGYTALESGLNLQCGAVLVSTAAYSSNVNVPYLIAGTSGYTGASTDWNNYGLQHRFKSDAAGVPRITVDGPSGEFLCVVNGGNVGIGTANPAQKLHVQDSSIRLNDAIVGSILTSSITRDTASSTIVPPKRGGIVAITSFSDYPDYPQPDGVAMIYYDTGASPFVQVMSTIASSNISVSITAYTGNPLDYPNDLITFIFRTDSIVIVNREDSHESLTFQLTFL